MEVVIFGNVKTGGRGSRLRGNDGVAVRVRGQAATADGVVRKYCKASAATISP